MGFYPLHEPVIEFKRIQGPGEFLGDNAVEIVVLFFRKEAVEYGIAEKLLVVMCFRPVVFPPVNVVNNSFPVNRSRMEGCGNSVGCLVP